MMSNNNPICVTRCPALSVLKEVVRSHYSLDQEIEFQLYKAKRAREIRGYVPVIKPWTSYSRDNRNRPLEAEEVDGMLLLGEMEWIGKEYL